MNKVLGKGTAYVMGASLIFVLCNYLIHVGLARKLGPAEYGLFGIVSSLYLLSTAFLTTGIPRAAARAIASNPKETDSIMHSAIKLQLIFASIISLLYLVLAFFIAPVILHDQSITKYIILVGLSSIPFGVVILYQNGLFNGQRLFKKQALTLIAHSLLRVIFVFVTIFIGGKVFGVFIAFFLAALLTIFLCFYINKNKETPIQNYPYLKIISFATPLTIAAVALTFIRDGNVLIIKSILHDNVLAGLYTSALTLSDLPYLVFAGVSLTLMPSIAKAIAENNILLTKKYISQTLRYLLLFLLPLIALLAANAKVFLHFFFSDQYASATPILQLLALSSLFLIFTLTLTSITTGGGKPTIEMVVYLSMVCVLVPLNIILLPSFGLIGAALALTAATFSSLCVMSVLVYRKFHSLIPFSSTLKISLSSFLLFLLAPYLPYHGPFFVLTHFLLLALYGCILFVFKEITPQDLALFKDMLQPNKATLQQNL